MIADALRRLGFGRLAHNTLLSAVWQAIRIGSQVLWVVVIARLFGAAGYGAFAGIAGLATAVGGLAGLGTGMLLLQNVSRNHEALATHWRKATVTTLISGLVLTALVSAGADALFGAHATLTAILAICMAELTCYPMVYVAGFAFQSHERLGWAGSLAATMSSARLVGVIIYSQSTHAPNLETYAMIHLAASIVACALALFVVQIVLRVQRAPFALSPGDLREGFGFSTIWFSGNALTELDKTLALRLAGSELAGIYSAAYRLVSALTLPVASLALAAQPRLFRNSSISLDGSDSRLIRLLLVVAAAYGCAASVVLLLGAGALPILLGPSFEPAAAAARLLILIPPLYALRLIGNTVLMTCGRQRTRVVIESLGLVLLIALSILWIPRFGLAGIAMTVTLTEAVLATVVLAIVWSGRRGARTRHP